MRSKGAGPGARQASPKVLAAAGGVIVLIAVAIVLAVVLGKSSGGTNGLGDTETLHLEKGTPAVGNSSTSTMQNATDVAKMFKGVPQNHFVLGSPSAPVTMTEFIDLQCPDCQSFELNELPALVKNRCKVPARIGFVKTVSKSMARATARTLIS